MSEKASENNSKAVKAGIGYTIGNILSKGLSFLAMPLFGRIMSVEDYGKYNTYTAYTSVFFVVAGLALHVSIKNAKIDYEKELKEYTSSLTLMIIINTLILMVLGIVCAGPLERAGLLERADIAVPIVLESFCMAMITYYNHVLAVDYRHKEYVVLSFIYAALGIVLSVVLIETVYTDERFMGRVMGMLISGGLFAVYILFRLYRAAVPKPDKEYWKYGLKISIPIVPHGVSQMILSLSDRVMIKKFCGDTKNGLYGFACNIGVIFTVVTTALDTAWSQWFFDKMEAGEKAEIRKAASIYAVVVAAGAILLMSVSPELIVLMGGEKFRESCILAFPIVMAMFYSFMFGFPSVVEYYHKRTWLIAAGTVFTAVLNIILNLVCIQKYGYVAAAYTTVGCYFVYYVIHVIFAYFIRHEFLYDMRVHGGCVALVSIAGFGFVVSYEMPVIRLMVLCAGIAAGIVIFLKYKKIILNLLRRK